MSEGSVSVTIEIDTSRLEAALLLCVEGTERSRLRRLRSRAWPRRAAALARSRWRVRRRRRRYVARHGVSPEAALALPDREERV